METKENLTEDKYEKIENKEKEPTNGKLYQEKIKEAIYLRFLDVKEKLRRKNGFYYKKGENPEGLFFTVINGGIEIHDYTQNTKKGTKIHNITLTYNEEKKEFNLRETLGVNQREWSNVPIDEVMNLLKEMEDKMRNRYNYTIDKTRQEIGEAIFNMFRDDSSKKGRLKKFLSK